MLEHGQRRLDEDGGDGAHHHDHERGRRQQRRDARALEHGADQHRDHREHETYGCQDIHGVRLHLPAAICDSNASMSSCPDTALAVGDPGDLRTRCRAPSSACAGNARTRLVTSLPSAMLHELAQHLFELIHERDDAADDLPGDVLVALRHQQLRQMRAQRVGVRARAIEERGGALRPQRGDRGMRGAIADPRLRAAAPQLRAPLVHQRSATLHEVERAMRGLVGELDDVRQALARVGHFVAGEHVETRLGAEARERRLRGRGDAFELGQQARRPSRTHSVSNACRNAAASPPSRADCNAATCVR